MTARSDGPLEKPGPAALLLLFYLACIGDAAAGDREAALTSQALALRDITQRVVIREQGGRNLFVPNSMLKCVGTAVGSGCDPVASYKVSPGSKGRVFYLYRLSGISNCDAIGGSLRSLVQDHRHLSRYAEPDDALARGFNATSFAVGNQTFDPGNQRSSFKKQVLSKAQNVQVFCDRAEILWTLRDSP
jgi:hypothetical protein